MKAACEEMEARGAADEVQHLRYSLRGEIWEQYISESRPSNTKVLTLEDPRSSLGQTCDLIGFYYPNKMTPIDILCEAGFLSNFWETDLEFSLPEGDSLQFQNAEAAFQATKYMEHANEFTTLSGEEAFKFKKRLNTPRRQISLTAATVQTGTRCTPCSRLNSLPTPKWRECYSAQPTHTCSNTMQW